MVEVWKASALLVVLVCVLSTEIISESKGIKKGRRAQKRSRTSKADKEKNTEIEPWQLNEVACPPALCEPKPSNLPGSAADGEEAPQFEPQTGGYPFFEGDIVLDKELERLLEHHKSEESTEASRDRHKRAIIRPTRRLWQYGVVPYVFSKSLNTRAKNAIQEAIAYYREKTCILIRPRQPKDDNFIKFIDQAGCWSLVGERGGQQLVNIGPGCEKLGTVLHELGHTLGFWHEQSRPDRDKYVQIVKKNIAEKYKNQFGKRHSEETSSRNFAYDYLSVMHYKDSDFSLNHRRTIKVIGEGQTNHFKIGQREKLSDLDIAQLNDMYYCNQKELAAKACPPGWTHFKSSCYEFVTGKQLNFDDAAKACEQNKNGYLARIDGKLEDEFLKTHLGKHYDHIDTWRVGGIKYKNSFVWYNSGQKTKYKKMKYKAWVSGYPKSYTSVVLRLASPSNRNFVWKATFTGNKKKPEAYAHAYICERKRKDKCFASKTSDGRDYRGKVSYTESFTTCQNWKSQYPHRHKYLTGVKAFDSSNGLGNHNNCRNPQGRRARPWCFTSKNEPTWEYCDVNTC